VLPHPDGEPFYCGTYYPPAPRTGMPSFRQLLDAVARPGASGERGARRAARSRAAAAAAAGCRRPVDAELLDGAAAAARSFDAEHGGFGGAPKFPPSMVLEFLLRRTRAPAATRSRWPG
jgi:uncharacterized protein YyaL (SSP411 family)